MFQSNEKVILGLMIAFYFVFLIAMSIVIKRQIKTHDDYNMAGRTVSVWPLILTFVGTGIGGATLLGYMENGYTLGMGQQWIHITMLGAIIILAACFLKRIRLIGECHHMVTVGDYTALRYGEAARIPTAISFLFAYCAMTGMQFVAIASILNLTIGLPITTGIIVGWLLLTIKTYLGGLKAVIWQDVVQGALLTIGVIVLCMAVFYYSGNWQDLHTRADMQQQGALLSVLNITPNEILIYLLTLACYQFIRQDVWQRIWVAKNLNTARKSYWISMIIAVAIGAITVLIGVYAKFGLELDIKETPLTYYYVIQDVFPFPIVALMIVVLLAAVISSADSFFISGASSIANDVIKPQMKQTSPEKLLRYSKLSVLVVSLIAVVLALSIPGLVQLMVTGTAMSVSGLLAPIVLGLFWKRPSNIAGILAMWTGLGTALLWQVLGHPLGIHPILVGLPSSTIVLLLLTMWRGNKKTYTSQ